MIHHLVIFTLRPDAQETTLVELGAALAALAGTVEGLEMYAFGRDLGLQAGNGDFAISAVFRDTDSLRRYLDNPEHHALLARYGPGLVAGKRTVQFSANGLWDGQGSGHRASSTIPVSALVQSRAGSDRGASE